MRGRREGELGRGPFSSSSCGNGSRGALWLCHLQWLSLHNGLVPLSFVRHCMLGFALASFPFLSFSTAAAAAAKSLQSCPTLCDPRDGDPRPWDSPGKNTGMSCHFLLQCMKVKSESEVAQSCPTLRDPTDGSPPGSSVPGILQARTLE